MSEGARPRLVVVGNGMAGMRAVEELLARAPDRFAITVIGAEPHTNYNRIQLSSVLAGDKTLDDIVINRPDWYAAHGICLIAGNRVVAIDPQTKVTLGDGSVVALRQIVVGDRLEAGGADRSRRSVLPNVRAFRDIRRCRSDDQGGKAERRAVVIGGGLLGLEAAWGLKRRGMAVSLVHLMPP